MVKIEKSYPAPASLSRKNGRTPSSYTEKDVILQLKNDFFGKCYLCNMGNLTDINVEHLRPHRGEEALKFDWDNLLFACPHCNFTKTKRVYDVILNCCREDPEELLLFSLGESNEISIQALSNRSDVSATADLLMEIFHNRSTGCRLISTEERVRKLLEEMNLFYDALDKFMKNTELPRYKRELTALLHRKAPFAAFKRAYLKANLMYYHELSELLA